MLNVSLISALETRRRLRKISFSVIAPVINIPRFHNGSINDLANFSMKHETLRFNFSILRGRSDGS